MVLLQLSNGSLTNSLGGVQVLFDGVAAPIVYARVNQTSVIVPFGVAGQASTAVQYSYNGAMSSSQSVPVALAARPYLRWMR